MPLNKENSMDYYGNTIPRCPFCDRVIEPGRHDLSEIYGEGEHTFDCPYCEKEITVSTSVSHSFSTDRQ